MTSSLFEQIRKDFLAARQTGLRAKDAAERLGLTEGAALAAFAQDRLPQLNTLPVKTPLATYAIQPRWLEMMQSLAECGPVMALTRNESTVHEKTGVYETVSGSEGMGIVLGQDIHLHLFLERWASGMLVVEPGGASDIHAKTSLQFFDHRGVAVHKIFPVDSTDQRAWQQIVERWADTRLPIAFEPASELTMQCHNGMPNAEEPTTSLARIHTAHPLFGPLAPENVTRSVPNSSVRFALYQASFTGLPIMVSVSSPGCIQTHVGLVCRIEPMDIHGKPWLNVLDPGFNLHLREDWIHACRLVQRPTAEGMITAIEALDSRGDVMLVLASGQQPGQPELQGWKDLVVELPAHDSEAIASC